jgi:hypothetical protein
MQVVKRRKVVQPVDSPDRVAQLTTVGLDLERQTPQPHMQIQKTTVISELPCDLSDKILAIFDRMEAKRRIAGFIRLLWHCPLAATRWLLDNTSVWEQWPLAHLERIEFNIYFSRCITLRYRQFRQARNILEEEIHQRRWPLGLPCSNF